MTHQVITSRQIKQTLFEPSLDPKLLQIDRTSAFDPVAFIGKGSSIEYEDQQVLLLTEVDLKRVTFETMLRSGETWVQGEEKLKRLFISGKVPLDAKLFQLLWENQSLIPESWKSKGHIFFDGTLLRVPRRDRCILSRYWGDDRALLFLHWVDGEWSWGCGWLDGDWDAESPSICLAS